MILADLPGTGHPFAALVPGVRHFKYLKKRAIAAFRVKRLIERQCERWRAIEVSRRRLDHLECCSDPACRFTGLPILAIHINETDERRRQCQR